MSVEPLLLDVEALLRLGGRSRAAATSFVDDSFLASERVLHGRVRIALLYCVRVLATVPC